MSRRRQILLYIAFGFASLALFLLLTFPFDVLGRRIETEVAQAVPGAAITINRIGPSLPLGIYLGDVTYEMPPAGGAETGATVHVDAVRIHPAWFKLLTFKPGLSFSIKALGGEASGQSWIAGPTTHLDVEASNLHLEDGGQLEKFSGVQAQGTLSGKLVASIGPPAFKGGPPTFGDGSLSITVDGARIKSGKVMGFPIPATDLGSPELAVTIEKGEAKIERFKAKSSDIDASVTGTLSVKQNIMQSPLHGTVKVKLTEEWLSRNSTIKSLLSMAGPLRKPDGTIELPLSGTLSRPSNFMPGMGMMHF